MIKGTLLIAWNPSEIKEPCLLPGTLMKKKISCLLHGTLMITGTLFFLQWNPNDKSNSIYYLEPR